MTGDYVANNDLIAAMILEGFEFKQDGKNAFFNIGKDSVEKLNSLQNAPFGAWSQKGVRQTEMIK